MFNALDNELLTMQEVSDNRFYWNENESSDEEDDGQGEKQVSNSEAAEYFKKCLSWMEQQNNVDPVTYDVLRH